MYISHTPRDTAHILNVSGKHNMGNVMKLIPILFLATACSQNKDGLLTSNKWTIKQVENITQGKIGPEELNKGTILTFRADGTFEFEQKNDFFNRTNSGTWVLAGSKLTLYEPTDTTSSIIEEITNKSLVWTTTQEDTLRFTFEPLKYKD